MKDRLERLLDIATGIPHPEIEISRDRFQWVFGSLIQEFLADLLYEQVKDHRDHHEAIRVAVSLAERWFGPDELTDWPFRRKWLERYIGSRALGKREGIFPEDDLSTLRGEFRSSHPKDEAQCEWYLGCTSTDSLEIDHKWPLSVHGPTEVSNLQWLCRKHNRNWKGNLVFWDNAIPFDDFTIADMPKR